MLDIILGSFLLLCFLFGLKDGFLKKIFALMGVLLGSFLAYRYFRFGSVFLMKNATLSPKFAVVVSFIIIFLAIYITFKILYKLLEPKSTGVSMINRIIGGLVGIVQGLILLSFILLGASFFHLPTDTTKEGSKLYTPILNIAPQLIDFSSYVIPHSTNQENPDSTTGKEHEKDPTSY